MTGNEDTLESVPNSTDSFTFKTEIKQLLNIIANSLYKNKDVFLRELVSNASDALNKLRIRKLTDDIFQPDLDLKITVDFDEDEGILTITDTGIGMTKDELVTNLGTIAHSGTKSFLDSLKEMSSTNSNDLIGQFGVGFYSSFMVSDNVVVQTRSALPDEQAYEWISSGLENFEIHPIEKEERGTAVIIHLNDDDKSYANFFRLKNMISLYSSALDYPIHIQDETFGGEKAIWRRPEDDLTEEQYTALYQEVARDWQEPLLHFNIRAEAPMQFYSVVFVPTHIQKQIFNPDHEWGIKLYARKVLVEEKNQDLLPNFLRFMSGVVDSEDIVLNVSREVAQLNKHLTSIKKVLTSKILRELSRLAKSDDDAFLQFWDEFGIFLKEGAATDQKYQEKLLKLLRFTTSDLEHEKLSSIESYIERMNPDQDKIYYLLADNLELARRSPHLEYFKAEGIEVLLLHQPVDSLLMMNVQEFDKVSFQNVDEEAVSQDEDTSKEAADEEKVKTDLSDPILAKFDSIVGEQVASIRYSDRMVTSVCRLVNPQGISSDMQRVYRFMDQEMFSVKKILELNPNHVLIKQLSELIASNRSRELVELTILQLLESVLLIEGVPIKPEDNIARSERIVELATKYATLSDDFNPEEE
ncbi:MAG: molecular chaperone HtpG [Candidatus Heimdallarchaeota archaeon]|nr:molecular chaperone HtpG [Candidatus Heimdallarchaeota archaeon]MCK5048762.1 molecular chaperone HtpG [Candidatus Heimdallarchaeota archaeon]